MNLLGYIAGGIFGSLLGGLSRKGDSPEIIALRNELGKLHNENSGLAKSLEAITEEMKKKKIETFEDLELNDKEMKKKLVQLAQSTPAVTMDGNNIALFGLTSTGKSTMLNSLLGNKVAETGAGETTTIITSYPGESFKLWDIPGRNDELSYLSMDYISFFKGLSRRIILIQATIKENSSMMKLLDELQLSYDIVFNKFDKLDEEEQVAVKRQIPSEVQQMGLKRVNKIYFISAKHPRTYDWIQMVNDFTR